MNYLIAHRFPKIWQLQVDDETSGFSFMPKSETPFADPTDYVVLMNDWPYALEKGIVHLVVWTRTPLAVDDQRGDLTPESRRLVDRFVSRFFVEKLGEGGEEKVLWFKNWATLQSVRALDHVHVLLRNVRKDVLEEWIKVPECHLLL